MSSSAAIDYAIDRLVSWGPDLDRAWLPADLLESVSTLGSFRGLGLDYDRRKIPDVDFADPAAPVEFLKMQLWGNKAADILRILRDQGAFPHETTLAKVKVKYAQDPEAPDEFTLDDVKYDGKVTARGTSFESHVSLLREVYDKYARPVRDLEDTYAMQFSANDQGARVSGQPICFLLDPPIVDLQAFCSYVFSSMAPFRLWGIPVEMGTDSVQVDAVDLHVGARLRVELMPDLIRIYLVKGGCGNSLLRIYTNLQHYYNASVGTINGQGNPVFTF
jgi:hypothetical protein